MSDQLTFDNELLDDLLHGCFVQITAAIFRSPHVSSNAVKLYGILLSYAIDKDIAWPKQETLCYQMGVTKNTLRKAVCELKSLGLVTTQRSGDGENMRYHVRKMETQAQSRGSNIEPLKPAEKKQKRKFCASRGSKFEPPIKEEVYKEKYINKLTTTARENPVTVPATPAPTVVVVSIDKKAEEAKIQAEAQADIPASLKNVTAPVASVPATSAAPAPSPQSPPPSLPPHLAFLETTLQSHPHWRAPLAAVIVPPGCTASPDAYRAGVLKNWLAGKGTPPSHAAPTTHPDLPAHLDPARAARLEAAQKRFEAEQRESWERYEAKKAESENVPVVTEEEKRRILERFGFLGAIPAECAGVVA